MSDAVRCFWCDRLFRPRQDGGKQQNFCRPSCRRAFHAALRVWALDAVGGGALTITDIKNGLNATRALLPAAETVLPGIRRPIVLELKILPEAVADLKRLGWLNEACQSSNSAIADAVVELTERALALRLRPF
jgi:hypothetical protein